MIKKLRIKFVSTSIISIFIVLVLIIGSINIINYINMNERTDHMLRFVLDNKGTLPRPEKKDKPHNIPYFNNFKGNPSPEVIFQTRYFTVILDKNSEVIMNDTSNIFAVTPTQAIEYAKKAQSTNKITGFINNYKYLKGTLNDNTAIIFIDCERDISLFNNFLYTSIFISLISLIFVGIVSYLLSSIAIKPSINAYEKQKKFITNASHEIKTPLTIISANTDIIEMSCGESKWINSTKSQITRLTELVNNLVALSRLDEENYVVQKSNLCLSDILEAISKNYEGMSLDDNKTFECTIESDIYYHGNEKNITQLLYILLDNAFKYSNCNGTIKINLKKYRGKIIIEVYNTTDPISKGPHNEFFDRFYRQDESHNSKNSGFGIGLSLARSIVNSHKGKITAKSIDGKSITVSVIF